jgi:RNA polymerase sigma-70 factor (ECF subfamily)
MTRSASSGKTNPRDMTSDEQLMLEFQKGSREAFAELFERYRQPAYAFFRRRLRDPARAEELAQETFMAVLRGIEKYEPRATFRSYLYAIAFRQLSSERRRAAHAADQLEAEPVAAPHADICEEQWVRRAVEHLDPAHREVLMLREYEELGYDEIAALLRIPLNTVRSRLFRARMELKSLLSPKRPEQLEGKRVPQ